MLSRFKNLLRDIWLFIEYYPLTLKLLHPNPLKRGYVVHWDDEDGSYYDTTHHGIIEINDHADWFVQKMISRGVPIIPVEEMRAVWAGRKQLDGLLKQYALKKK